MCRILKKNIGSLLNRSWVRNFNGFITSCNWLVIYNRGSRCKYWNYVACLLKKEGDTYDDCSKKST